MKRNGGFWKLAAAGLGAGMAIGLALPYLPAQLPTFPNPGEPAPVMRQTSSHFDLCFTGGGFNCVVDGDTFWIGGEKVRVADIDAPETHPPRCAYEQALGDHATKRLQELLNDGPVQLESIDRDKDVYGRNLRIVTRDGKSLGQQLIREGLAHPWTGSRQPWC
jgi:micrococcal nuclease